MNKYRFSVIVVEDEALIAKNIVKNIERANDAFYVVTIAYDGETALKIIDTYMPDVVFTDIKMPVMSGLELLKRLNEKYPQIKTIVLSGYNEFEYAKTAITYDVKNYLLKPVNFDELKKTLSDLQQQLIADRGKLAGFQQLTGKSTDEIVNSVKEFIDSNYTQHIDFSIIARNVGFSQAYLSKVFSKYFDAPPSRYLINTRIREAKKLLITTDLTIRQISDALGYIDQFYFSKSFKNEIGMSPNKFRSNNNT